MAITITQRPVRFSPSGNPIVWQFASNAANLHHFKVEVIEQSTGGIIYTGKFAPLPDLQSGTVARLERFLANIVRWELNNTTDQFIAPMSNTIKGYRVKVTEVLLSGSSYVDGAVYNDTNDINYVYNANLDIMSFKNLLPTDYVITASNTGNFLTGKPSRSNCFMGSSEFLYFMQDGTPVGLKSSLKVYNADGTLVTTKETNVPSISLNLMYRLNVSPKAIYAAYGVLVEDGQYYTVQILNSAGDAMTDLRTFFKKKTECHLEFLNVLWANSLGGVDSYQFVNPVETKTNAKVTIKTNKYKIVSGLYKDITSDIFNPVEQVISNIPTVTVKAYTRLLTDQEVAWLGDLVDSEQVFIELSNGTIVPVLLTKTSYTYQRGKYMQGQPNLMDFEFQFEPGLVPAFSNKKVSYIVNTTFSSDARSMTFTKNDCAAGSYGTQVTMTTAPGAYTSTISQAHANSLADDYLSANGQAYANANGSCVATPQVPNQEKSQTFTRNNCGAGYTGTAYTYTVPAGTYYAPTQTEANALAQDNIDANGQNAANTNGTCVVNTYGNVETSGVFTRNNCGSGYTGSSVTYTVAANTYFATTQSGANTLAQNDVNSNGQAYANTNGTCNVVYNEVSIYITQTMSTNGDGTSKCRVQAFASAAVNTNLTLGLKVYKSDNTVLSTPTISLNSGASQSSLFLLGNFNDADNVQVILDSITPNYYNGYHYNITIP